MEDIKEMYKELGVSLCPPNCKFLNITEEMQDRVASTGLKLQHRCRKVNQVLFHGCFHPELVQLEECKKEILFRRFV